MKRKKKRKKKEKKKGEKEKYGELFFLSSSVALLTKDTGQTKEKEKPRKTNGCVVHEL